MTMNTVPPETVHVESVRRPRFLLIAAVGLGVLLNPLNSSMIAVALSRLQEEFRLSFADVSWLISTYYLASAIGLPVMGKLTDMWGRKRLFLSGLAMVAVSSFLAPLSPSFGWLIAFRILQAIGSSILYPAGMGMIRKSITENQAQALGVLSAFSSTSAAFGPSIGGFLIHFGDWPAIFLINFPFILTSFILSLKVFPKDNPDGKNGKSLDLGGAALFSLLIVSGLLFLLSFRTGIRWWEGLLCAVFAGWFYVHEKRRKDPFIDVRAMVRNVNVSLVYVQFILVNIIFYSIFFGVPPYLQQVHRLDAGETGLIMLTVAGFGVIISPLAGRWIDRKGSKPSLFTGTVLVILGSLLLLTVGDASSSLYIAAVLSVLGIGSGFNNIGMITALYSFVAPEETGIASGLFMTSRFIGTILSSALLGVIFGTGITTAHFHTIAIACAAVGGIILLLSLRMPARAEHC